jgi:hypothetical protein
MKTRKLTNKNESTMRKKLTYLAVLVLLSLRINASTLLDDPCLPPSNIEITELTTFSVNFEWTHAGAGDDGILFQYVITEDNNPLGGPVTPETQGTSINYTLLSPGTNYNLYMRTLCLGTWSDWANAVNFTTPSCGVTDLPYIQDFETLTPFNLIECASWEINSGNFWSVSQDAVAGFDGNTLRYTTNETEDADSWYIFSGGVNILNGDKIKVSFKYASDGTGVENMSLFAATSIEDLTSGMGMQIANLTITDATVNEYSAGPIPMSETAVYYFGFQATSTANQGTIYVDDFKVEEWTCGTPADVNVHFIEENAALVSWVATGDNTIQFFQYVASDEPIEPNDSTPGILSTGTVADNLIEDLASNTTYYVYVRAFCSGVWGSWTEAVSFTTLCPSDLPLPVAEATQTLEEGQTLAHLEVDGENLTWYADADLTTEIEATTIATDQTTYYVTQTIDGCETEAIAITVEVTLSADSISTLSFKAFPNPVQNVLNVSSDKEITHIEVINMLGQTVLSKSFNTTQAQIDMSGLLSGNYFVRVTAGNTAHTLRVVK